MNDMTVFGIELGLLIAELGIVVTALSAAAGIWFERDKNKSLRNPIALTILIAFASALAMYQCREEEAQQGELEENLAKVLEQLDEVATQSEIDVPDLNDLLKSEIMIHGRSNPRVLIALARRIAAKGGDPLVVLAAYLPEADLQAMKREGRFDEAMEQPAAPKAPSPTARPKLTFGSGVSQLRNKEPEIADAGVDDARAPNEVSGDGGPADEEAPEAGIADSGSDAGLDASVNAGTHDAGPKLGKRNDDDDDDESATRAYEKVLEEINANKVDAGPPSPAPVPSP